MIATQISLWGYSLYDCLFHRESTTPIQALRAGYRRMNGYYQELACPLGMISALYT